MKARYLTVLISVLVTAGMTFSLLFVARRIVLDHLLDLENRRAREDMRRSVKQLDTEVQDLDRIAKDYAAWDDTYAFMRSRDPRYLASNFADATVENLKVRTLMLLDVDGRIAAAFSLQRTGLHQEQNSDIEKLTSAATLVSLRRDSRSMTGILGMSNGPVLVSMRPILSTDEKGPSRGTLIMLRDLDFRLLARVSTLAGFPMGIYRKTPDTSSLQSSLQDGVHSLNNISIRTIDNDQLAVTTELNDWFGHPSYELEIIHGREVWQQGQHAYRFLTYSILIFGCVFGGLVLVAVHLVYVRRVRSLTIFTERIKNEEDLSSRIHFCWKDELAILAERINQMLEDLQSSHEKLALASERLQHEATHDSLTGAWNCAAALELLDREISRSEREQSQVAVFMLDIDHFKAVNDRFGHATGDRALQAITTSVGRILRTTDILARYGGEEFLIIAPNCNLAEARRLADRILLRLQATLVEVGEQRLSITVSIGLVAGGYPLSSEELIALADRALYRAKEKGRNRFECEEALPARVKGTLYCMPRRTV